MVDDAKRSVAAIDDGQWAVISEAIWQLENSWHADSPIELSDLLPPAGDPLRPRVLVELIKVDQEHRWEAGDRKMLETYLDEWAELADRPELVTELLEAECETRATTDTVPSPDEIRSRFPNICDRIDLERVQAESDKDRGICQTEVVSPASSDTPLPALEDTSSKAAGQSPLRVGQLFGRYEIRELLGQGGMGTVYLAYDTQLERDVALKVPRCDPATDQPFLERFIREAKTAAGIGHQKNICPIYDAGEIDGTYFLTMAFIEGCTLDEWSKSQTVDPRTAASLVRKLASALETVHAAGIIHRDIKPSNVMLDASEEPVLMDFGLARVQERSVGQSTDVGFSGSPPYMSPEQVNGDDVDVRSDLYSLGILLYQLLTDELPYYSKKLPELIATINKGEPPKPSSLRSELDSDLEAICLKAMAKSATDRYQTAEEFAHALQRYLDARSTRLTRWMKRVAAAAVSFMLIAVIILNTGNGVFVVAVPEGAILKIDGQQVLVESEEISVVLSVGNHEMEVAKPGFHTEHSVITIRWRGSTVRKSVELETTLFRYIETGKHTAGIALSADGLRLLVGRNQGERGDSPIDLFGVSSGKPLERILLERGRANGNPHWDLVLSPDEKYLFTVNYYGDSITRVALRDNNAREDLKVSTEIAGNVWSKHIGITPDGKKLVVTLGSDGFDDSSNDRISIIDVSGDNFALIGELEVDGEPTSECGLAIDAAGEFAYVITKRPKPLDPVLHEVRLTAPYAVSRSVEIPGGEICGVALSSELRRVFVSDRAQRKIWGVDLDTFKPLPGVQFRLPEQVAGKLQHHAPGALAMRSDRHLLVALCPDTRKVFCLDSVDGTVLARVDDLRDRLIDAEFSRDLRHLLVASAGPEGGVAVIDLDSLLTRIVFASKRDGGGYQLYSMCGGGHQPARLSENVFTERSPRWSPDGRRIAFLSDRNGNRVCVMGRDGKSVAVLDETDPKMDGQTTGSTIDWSPDGTEIAFIAEGGKSIRTVDVLTGNVRTLWDKVIEPGYQYCVALSWTGDGTILFASQNAWGYYHDVFVLDPNTKEVTQLTNEWGKNSFSTAPALSPSGKTIAVARQPGNRPPPREIYLMNRDGGGLRALTHSPGAIYSSPAWFPDGRKIACAAKAGDYHDIYAVPLESGEPVPLALGAWDDIEPDVCSLLRRSSDHTAEKANDPDSDGP